jgi:hypothetical protein
MKYLSYLALFILISCGSGEVKRNVETPYRSSGIEQFFLPELPNWANYSSSGQCYKVNSFLYMDFARLIQTYQLDYVQMIELQAQYNQKLDDYFRSTRKRFLRPVEEASFFANTFEQVKGGVRALKLPPVKEVEIIWLESFLINNDVEKLKKLAASGRFDEKLPILLSTCHSRQSLTQWLAEKNLSHIGFYVLTAEWLSPYGSDGLLRPGLQIEIKKLLGEGIEISYFSSNKKYPEELFLP